MITTFPQCPIPFEYDLELGKSDPTNSPEERCIRILDEDIRRLESELEKLRFIRDTIRCHEPSLRF